MSNDKKNATLGMPHGTAANRLRKNILYSLLVKYNEDICFKCGKRILRVEDLSIEHKQPWEGISAELFWDLNNIAFSHIRCNRPNRPNFKAPEARVMPVGMNWCWRHKSFFSVDRFSKDRTKKNGLSDICKDCQHYYRDDVPVVEQADTVGLNPTG